MIPYKYIEWFDAGEMHEHSKKWFSELSFIKDEQQFLNSLIQTFAVKPLDQDAFRQLNDFNKAIAENKQRLISIFKQVQKHMNQLVIILDEVNQIEMEQAYRKTHKNLFMKVNQCVIDFRNIKQRGFSNLTGILKKNHAIPIGNPSYKLKTTNSSSS